MLKLLIPFGILFFCLVGNGIASLDSSQQIAGQLWNFLSDKKWTDNSAFIPFINIGTDLCQYSKNNGKNVQIGGNTEFRDVTITGFQEMSRDFSINFLDTNGTFSSNLTINIPELAIVGTLLPDNFIHYWYSFRIPKFGFNQSSEFSTTINSLTLKIHAQGVAPMVQGIELQKLTYSLDWGYARTDFGSLWATVFPNPGLEIVEDPREFASTDDFFVFMSWALIRVSGAVSLQDRLEEAVSCNLQHVLKDCSLMDLLVSGECMQLELQPNCLTDQVFDISLDESVPKRNVSDNVAHKCYDPPLSIKYIDTKVKNDISNILDFGSLNPQTGHFFLNETIQSLHHDSSPQDKRFATKILLPPAAADFVWRDEYRNILGGHLDTWDCVLKNGTIADEKFSKDFIDENGTFWMNYTIHFSTIDFSGSYDTDMTIYTDYDGEWRVWGQGSFDWAQIDLTITVNILGAAQASGFVSFQFLEIIVTPTFNSYVTFQISGLTDTKTAWNGTMVDRRHPETIKDLETFPIISDFFFRNRIDKEDDYENRFFTELASHFKCGLNKALEACTLLDLIVSPDCVQYEGLQECFSGQIATIRPPEIPKTTSLPSETTSTSWNATETEIYWTTQSTTTFTTTEKPGLPGDINLLLNQTKILIN